jgi:hypothetical protein
LMLYFVSTGNDLYTAVANGKSMQQITEKMESKCR